MNKTQLIEAVTDKLTERSLEGMTSSDPDTARLIAAHVRVEDRKIATLAVETLFDTVVRAVVEGRTVNVTGFGTLKIVERKARIARNPKTGEPVQVPATKVPVFRSGASFKALVDGKKALVDGVSAVKKAPKTFRKRI